MRGLYSVELNRLTDEIYEHLYSEYLKDLLDEAERIYNSDLFILNRYSVHFQ